jgi:aspartyl/asparaginyl beta-hydroxylase (cupin superfamily)
MRVPIVVGTIAVILYVVCDVDVSVLASSIVSLIATNATQAIFPTADVEWAADLRAQTPMLRDEWLQWASRPPLFRSLDWRQKTVDPTSKWRTLWLRVHGIDAPNMAHFPRLAAALSRIPCRSAMFSVLEPHSYLDVHIGPTNLVWRYHLGLVVPPVLPTEHLELGVANGDTLHLLRWANGSDLMFDDSFPHYVENTTPRPRVVLFLDVERTDIRWFARPLYRIMLWAVSWHPWAQELATNIAHESRHV